MTALLGCVLATCDCSHTANSHAHLGGGKCSECDCQFFTSWRAAHASPTTTVVTPFKARAPKPEPEAVLRFGDVEVRITLTYLHHLRNCQGWGDKETTDVFRAADEEMSKAMEAIEKAMWTESDR